MGRKQGIIKKVGPYEQDHTGIIVKRPGKAFRIPEMPLHLKISSPRIPSKSESVCGLYSRDIYEAFSTPGNRKYVEMNALKEANWRATRKKEYTALRNLYYLQQMKKAQKKVCKKAISLYKACFEHTR